MIYDIPYVYMNDSVNSYYWLFKNGIERCSKLIPTQILNEKEQLR